MTRHQPRQPNVLWLMCDELRPDGVGCYGNKWGVVDTPNLDSLAETGTRFDRFFVNSPICVSSRTAYLTGRRPTVTGAYGNEASYRWFPPETCTPQQQETPETFVQMLAGAGYVTHNLGKQHLNRLLEPFETSDTSNADQWRLMQAVSQDGVDIQRNGVGSAIGGVWPTGHEYPHDALADQAGAWLAEVPTDKPWLLRVSFLQPHTPVVVPEPFASRFVDQDWTTPGDTRASVSAFEQNFGDVTRPSDVDDEWISLARARYYGLAAWLDHQIGQVLSALQESGQRDSTVVVFCSDHGAGLGERGNWAKHVFAPQVQGSPLIVAGVGIDQGVLRVMIATGLIARLEWTGMSLTLRTRMRMSSWPIRKRTPMRSATWPTILLTVRYVIGCFRCLRATLSQQPFLNSMTSTKLGRRSLRR